MGLDTHVESISPEVARVYLESNRINRPLRPTAIQSYAEDMKNGDWLLNGETICFDENGKLVDGQHRLLAVIQSGCVVDINVSRGVKEENAVLYDRGSGRDARDTLSMKGYPCAVSRYGPAIARVHFILSPNTTINARHKVSDAEIVKFIDQYETDLIKIIGISEGGKKCKGGVNTRQANFQYALFCAYKSGEDIKRLGDFVSMVRTGYVNDSKMDVSAITLRNDIIYKKIDISKNREKKEGTVNIYIENAIYDFCRFKSRKRTYSTCKERVYADWESDK